MAISQQLRLLRRYYAAVRLPATVHVGLIAHRLLPLVRSVSTTDRDGISRFSGVEFLGVPGVFDYAGLNRNSRYRPCSCCLPRVINALASGLYVFAAQCPTPPSSIYASLGSSR